MRLLGYLLGAALLAAALFGGCWAYREGRHAATVEWQTKYQTLVDDTERASHRETVRQQNENIKARLHADGLVIQLQETQAALAEAKKELAVAASRDPHAGRVSLGADSVRRITTATPPR